jgi:hypothetical protein
MIGRSLNLPVLRIACMVSCPSMPGIMMSISTMSTPGVEASFSMASWPVSAEMTSMRWRSRTLVIAKMFRMSSSTISTFLPESTRSVS